MFPSVGKQALSSLIHFLGVSILTHCLSRRIAAEDLTSMSGLSQLSWPRACIILVFLDSWLFIFSSGVLIFGVGLELHHSVCTTAVGICVIFYATSKLLIYAFLIERVHIVWPPATGTSRFKSPIYVVCLITVALYAVVIGLMIVGRVGYFRGDGACVIGLRPISAYPLLIYDLYINIFLTTAFLWPIMRTSHVNPRVKRIARRALIAATVALTTSSANILVLALLKGNELGWICLGSCGGDVIFNSLALFWVTSGRVMKPITTSTYVSEIPDEHQLKIAPLRSILVSRTDQSQQYNKPGPHRITNAYYHSHEVTLGGSSSGTTGSQYQQDPNHPFSAATFNPKVPQPDVWIRADPTDSPTISTMRTLANMFRNDSHESSGDAEIEIKVTTEVDIASYEYEDHINDRRHSPISEGSEPDENLSDSHIV
ncbi:hypothetical protein C8J56DRAFT_1045839 [Mycena floridula]|nr:hypothetical protein C8J56DRAFT_1045839 [Mycena floridula]